MREPVRPVATESLWEAGKLLLQRRKIKREEERVWATDACKFAGVCDEILEKTAAGGTVLVIGHFKKTIDALLEAVRARGIDHAVLTEARDLDLLVEQSVEKARVLVLLSELIPGSPRPVMPQRRGSGPRGKVQFVVVEHYPIPEGDASVLSFASSLPFAKTIRFHASMEEPLIKAFGGDRTFEMLARLGWRKNEPISSSAVTFAIASSQRRIKKIARSNERVSSQEEWFRYNCPPVRNRR